MIHKGLSRPFTAVVGVSLFVVVSVVELTSPHNIHLTPQAWSQTPGQPSGGAGEQGKPQQVYGWHIPDRYYQHGDHALGRYLYDLTVDTAAYVDPNNEGTSQRIRNSVAQVAELRPEEIARLVADIRSGDNVVVSGEMASQKSTGIMHAALNYFGPYVLDSVRFGEIAVEGRIRTVNVHRIGRPVLAGQGSEIWSQAQKLEALLRYVNTLNHGDPDSPEFKKQSARDPIILHFTSLEPFIYDTKQQPDQEKVAMLDTLARYAKSQAVSFSKDGPGIQMIFEGTPEEVNFVQDQLAERRVTLRQQKWSPLDPAKLRRILVQEIRNMERRISQDFAAAGADRPVRVFAPDAEAEFLRRMVQTNGGSAASAIDFSVEQLERMLFELNELPQNRLTNRTTRATADLAQKREALEALERELSFLQTAPEGSLTEQQSQRIGEINQQLGDRRSEYLSAQTEFDKVNALREQYESKQRNLKNARQDIEGLRAELTEPRTETQSGGRSWQPSILRRSTVPTTSPAAQLVRETEVRIENLTTQINQLQAQIYGSDVGTGPISKNELINYFNRTEGGTINILKFGDRITRRNTLQKIFDQIALKYRGQNRFLGRIVAQLAGISPAAGLMGSTHIGGPPGIGKTSFITFFQIELGGEGSEKNMAILNGGELTERHAVSVFKGAPPGFVGYEAGILRRHVLNGGGIFLIDEIDKAHPEVLNAILDWEKGYTYDFDGNRIPLDKVWFATTTNRGQHYAYLRLLFERGDLDPDNKDTTRNAERIDQISEKAIEEFAKLTELTPEEIRNGIEWAPRDPEDIGYQFDWRPENEDFTDEAEKPRWRLSAELDAKVMRKIFAQTWGTQPAISDAFIRRMGNNIWVPEVITRAGSIKVATDYVRSIERKWEDIKEVRLKVSNEVITELALANVNPEHGYASVRDSLKPLLEKLEFGLLFTDIDVPNGERLLAAPLEPGATVEIKLEAHPDDPDNQVRVYLEVRRMGTSQVLRIKKDYDFAKVKGDPTKVSLERVKEMIVQYMPQHKNRSAIASRIGVSGNSGGGMGLARQMGQVDPNDPMDALDPAAMAELVRQAQQTGEQTHPPVTQTKTDPKKQGGKHRKGRRR